MTLKEWSKEIKQILDDWAEADKEAKAQLDEAEEEIHDQKLEIEELRAALASGPEWGNCRRGCPPAYLNNQGYCSLDCELGKIK